MRSAYTSAHLTPHPTLRRRPLAPRPVLQTLSAGVAAALRAQSTSEDVAAVKPEGLRERQFRENAERVGRWTAAEYHDADFRWADIEEAGQRALDEQVHAGLRRLQALLVSLQQTVSIRLTQPAQERARSVGVAPRATSEFRAATWEAFHAQHSTAQFFRQRRYLSLAWPQLTQQTPPLHIVELGCGAGASIVPILKARLCRPILCSSPSARSHDAAKEQPPVCTAGQFHVPRNSLRCQPHCD